jgi:PPOX class probable F420-dependent enzyme
MDSRQARERFAGARVAHLATADNTGRPHIVPFVHVVIADVIYFAIDSKPKGNRQLRRLDNIASNPRVSALADHYTDDWTHLWWARADGIAHIIANDSEVTTRVLTALAHRYPSYQQLPPPGPVIAIHVTGWSGWTFDG